jgi:outer membrane receptor protein involved in Fe transport
LQGFSFNAYAIFPTTAFNSTAQATRLHWADWHHGCLSFLYGNREELSQLKVSTGLLWASWLIASSWLFSQDLSRRELLLAGVVVDTSSGKPLQGASVKVVELGRKTTSDCKGKFEFQGMPAGEFTMCVHLPGYKADHFLVSVPGSGEVEVALLSGYQFQDEITVTATPWSDEPLRIPQQIDALDSERIEIATDGSLGLIAGDVPGVRTSYTGDSSSKPVIRGLTGNRIRTLNDGIPTSYQQFGIRHQPNVELLGSERVEIVRGPASVLYGADAMGGVVNVIQPPLPVAESSKAILNGEIYGGYSANTGGGTGFCRLEGALGGFGWRGSLIRRSFGDIQTPDLRLENTDFHQTNGDLAAGFTGVKGSIRVRWHHWENNAGFFSPRDFRVDLKDDLIAADAFLPTKVGGFEFLFGHQHNIRKAFPEGLGNEPAVHLKLNNNILETRFHHPSIGVLRGTIAGQFAAQDNKPLGLDRLLPEYKNDSWAFSIFEEARFAGAGLDDRWLLSFALRYDNKKLEVSPDKTRGLADGYQANWDAVTTSAGLLYRLNEKFSLAASLGRGWRAPSEFEFFVKGVHGGIGAIQIGDLDLMEEANLNSELSLRWAESRIRGYVTFFNNAFENYIYLANTSESEGDLPIFEHRQTDAWLRGIETNLELALAKWLKSSLSFDYLATRNRSTKQRLPLNPPTRIMWSGRVEDRPRGDFSGTYAEIRLSWCDSGRVSGIEEPFPYNTDSYIVFGLSGGTSYYLAENAGLTIDLIIHNLLNTRYRDFLYTYKGVADMPGRDVRIVARLRF